MNQSPPLPDTDILPANAVILTERHQAVALCGRLHELTARMSDLLAEEASCLKARQLDQFSALQSEKAALSTAFLKAFTSLKANATFVGAQAPRHLDQLRHALSRLRTSSQGNAQVLEATRSVSHGLLTAIFNIAREKRSPLSCYGADAQVAAPTTARPTTLAMDQRF